MIRITYSDGSVYEFDTILESLQSTAGMLTHTGWDQFGKKRTLELTIIAAIDTETNESPDWKSVLGCNLTFPLTVTVTPCDCADKSINLN